MTRAPQVSRGSTVDEREIAQFAEHAGDWWDERGSLRMLHRLNPLRIAYIRDHAIAAFGGDARKLDCLAGLRILDIGCGGGILSEPLARLGASVVGVDPGEDAVAAARAHAGAADVAVEYRCTTAEALADAGERFDAVLAMEVVEHVADLGLFVERAAEMVRPGGLLIAATINRTFKSFALAIVAAEYVLGWVPRGTHRWERLVTPDELEAALEAGGMRAFDGRGVVYDPFAGEWRLSDDMDVNYMMAARRAAEGEAAGASAG